ncbi:MAG: tetratricopeptide repeat protein, partial [Planctomycetota bacterium]|nr:tetratricopeptide repeat protein [Planctomycetota bacterium]
MTESRNILLGRIVVQLGFVTREQIEQCVSEQDKCARAGEKTHSLGTILLRKRFLTQAQLDQALQAQQQALHKEHEWVAGRKEDVLFGKLWVTSGILPEGKVNECLRLQAQMHDQGVVIRLGELAIKKGFLTAAQVTQTLRLQHKTIMRCGSCAKSFNVPASMIAKGVRCPHCNGELALKEPGPNVAVAGSAPALPVFKHKPEQRSEQHPASATEATMLAGDAIHIKGRPAGRSEDMVVTMKAPTSARPGAGTDPGQTPDSAPTVLATDAAGAASASKPGSPLTGKPFGRYMLLDVLGRGGMGVVYKAWDGQLQRVVTIKGEGDEIDSELVRRFIREAQSAAKLSHANIVQIHDIGVFEGTHYFTMDYLEGRNLKSLLENRRPGATRGRPAGARTDPRDASRKSGRSDAVSSGTATHAAGFRLPANAENLDTRSCMLILREVARALQHAHELGIIHRDLKPANIIVTPDRGPVVTDFGLARDVKGIGKSGLTMSGQVIGTPGYMPPEQAEGHVSKVGPHSDVYALGVIMYEMLTGRMPFESDNVYKLLQKVVHEDPAPPSSVCRTVHRDIETICLKAMEKDPARRYPAAGEFADDIERFLNGEPIGARPVSAVRRVARRLTKNRAAFVGFAAAILIGLGVGVFFLASAVKHGSDLQDARTAMEATLKDAESLGTAPEVPGPGELDSRQKAWERVKEAAANLLVLAADDPPGVKARDESRNRLAEISGLREAEKRRIELERDRANVKLAAASVADKVKGLDRYLYSTALPIGEYWKAIDECLAEFDNLVLAHPDVAEVWYFRGRLKLMLSQHEEAEADLCKALELEPAHYMARLYRARLYAEWFLALSYSSIGLSKSELRQKTVDKHEKAVADIAAIEKASAPIRWAGEEERTRVLIDASHQVALVKYDVALEILAKAGGDSPHEEYLNLVGAAWFMKGDAAKCEEAQTKALNRRPRYWKAFFDRGNARYAQRNIDGAIADWTGALEVNNRFVNAYLNRGVARAGKGDYDGAVADWEAVLKLNPKSDGAYHNRGLIRKAKGDFAGAMADYDKALEINPHDPQTLNSRGVARSEQNDFPGAIADLDKAIAESPKYSAAYYNRGNARVALGKADAALEDYAKAIEYDRSNTKAFLARGNLYSAMNNVPAAIADYSAALELEPTSATAHVAR